MPDLVLDKPRAGGGVGRKKLKNNFISFPIRPRVALALLF